MDAEKEKPETQEEKRQRLEKQLEELREKQLKAADKTIKDLTKYQWEKTDELTAAAAVTTMELKMDYDDNRKYTITHLAASDDSTTGKTIQLYNVKAGQRHLLNSDVTSAAMVAIVWDGELMTGPNQSVQAVFTTPTATDKLIFTVHGYWVEK